VLTLSVRKLGSYGTACFVLAQGSCCEGLVPLVDPAVLLVFYSSACSCSMDGESALLP
jgi:hypothetical protein